MNRTSKLLKISALVGLSFMVIASAGCKKSSNDNSQDITGRSGRGSSNVIDETAHFNAATGTTSSQGAYVTVDATYYNAFQLAVQKLVSGQMDPEAVGDVSTSTGIKIRGSIQIDSKGSLNSANSRIALEIVDEYVGQTSESGGQIPSITMTLPGASGQAYNNQFQIVFRDSIGEILIQGTYTSGSAGGVTKGQVYFTNYKNWEGSTVSSPQRVGLGNFSIATCDFFKCS